MRTFTLSKALSGANSPRDYADMAEGKDVVRTYSCMNKPYHIGGVNLIKEQEKMLKKKGVSI